MSNSYKDALRIANDNKGVDTTLRAVVSGDGDTTGLSLEDGTTGNVQIAGNIIAGSENVDGGNGGGSATALSVNKLTSFVTTGTAKSHVSLADGTAGQLKIIFHKTRNNTTDLVITPANFAAGSTLTSDAASRGVMLVFDGTNWQVLGEITGTAEFVVG
tara:strand:+ start:2408 stop:2884 length:477 start_codon:yes stop_codon:yes gene_type:complete